MAKWHFETAEDEVEVDSSNIIEGPRRKRAKVDYQVLDQQLDHSSKRGAWEKEYSSLKEPSNTSSQEFLAWLKSSATATNDAIAERRGGLSGGFKSKDSKKAAKFLESLGISKFEESLGFVKFGVKHGLWRKLLKKHGIELPVREELGISTVDDVVAKLSANPQEDVDLLTILQSLKSATVDTETLKRTKIGILVNKFTKSENLEISSLAKELVEKWKAAFLKEQGGRLTSVSE